MPVKRMYRIGELRPLVSPEGKVLVNRRKFPALYASLERGLVAWRKEREQWARVWNLRRRGHDDQADRLAKKLIGVQGPPMTEEKKEYLRQWKLEHKDEIAERKRMKATVRQHVKAIVAAPRRQLVRRRR